MSTVQTQNPAVANLQARATLLQTGLRFTKILPGITQGQAILGQQVRIPLDRIGITTGVTLLVTAPVDVTAATTQSPFGPWNVVSALEYVDFAGVRHIQTTGPQLHILNAIKTRRSLGNSAKMYGYVSSETGIDTDLLVLPTAVANANIQFALYVPLAYDPSSDLRGSVLAQTDRGEHYINLTFVNALVGTDPFVYPYTAGTATLQAGATITVEAFQHYIMPQGGVAPNNLPMIDLSTIYEIQGNLFDNANIAAGLSKYTNWPNNRAIFSALHLFNQGAAGGTLNGTDLSRITLLVNGNTNVREQTPSLLRLMMRDMMGFDFPSGVYYLGARTQPITTQLYGNVQTKWDVLTAGAGTYIQSQFESTYLSGTPLPGVIQQ
ncbi:MAG: hypothetical protein ACP5QA_10445 [Phycisphaerae bacterium]